MKFKVEWEAVINGNKMSGVESEESWFLVDQQGNMYTYVPTKPLKSTELEYTKCVPLFKIGDEWLSFEEIEQRITTDKNGQRASKEKWNQL